MGAYREVVKVCAVSSYFGRVVFCRSEAPYSRGLTLLFERYVPLEHLNTLKFPMTQTSSLAATRALASSG